jgi:hypothetical protein
LFGQRAAPDPQSFKIHRLWRPAGIRPRRGDSYVAIDELFDGVVTLAVANWPRVDRGGRLRFEESERVAVDGDQLQAAVSRRRRAQGEDAWDRPLRIGDVFLVRGRRTANPESWREIIDVSTAARDAAKVAANAAVAPAYEPDEELPPEEERDEPPEPPSGAVARPMV